MLTPCTIFNFSPNAIFEAEMVIDAGRSRRDRAQAAGRALRLPAVRREVPRL